MPVISAQTVKISELETITNIENGDKIVVDTQDGTKSFSVPKSKRLGDIGEGSFVIGEGVASGKCSSVIADCTTTYSTIASYTVSGDTITFNVTSGLPKIVIGRVYEFEGVSGLFKILESNINEGGFTYIKFDKQLVGLTPGKKWRLLPSASGDYSHAEGYNTTASGNYSHVEGSSTTASGTYSHAECYSTIASGNYSHAEGYGNIASGSSSHAEGDGNTASGSKSHAEGQNTTASGDFSHAEGYNTTASGARSHAEGSSTTASNYASHAEGNENKASGNYSHAEGYNTTASGSGSHTEGSSTVASGANSHAEGQNTTASNYASHASGKYNVAMIDGGNFNNKIGTAFLIGNGTGSSALSNAFSVQYSGVTKCASTFTASTTADYAEFFEWLDKNKKSEDRVGYFVTMDGDKVKIASNKDDYILGVVSGEPFVLGNGDCDTWTGMYLRDDFRRTIWEDAPKMEEVLDEEGKPTGEYKEVLDENGNIVYEGKTTKLNPDYDPSKPYVSRFDRPEWAPIGMLGVLAVRQDGTLKVNGYATVNKDGIATSCNFGDKNSYRVIKVKNDGVAEIIFR